MCNVKFFFLFERVWLSVVAVDFVGPQFCSSFYGGKKFFATISLFDGAL